MPPLHDSPRTPVKSSERIPKPCVADSNPGGGAKQQEAVERDETASRQGTRVVAEGSMSASKPGAPLLTSRSATEAEAATPTERARPHPRVTSSSPPPPSTATWPALEQ